MFEFNKSVELVDFETVPLPDEKEDPEDPLVVPLDVLDDVGASVDSPDTVASDVDFSAGGRCA